MNKLIEYYYMLISLPFLILIVLFGFLYLVFKNNNIIFGGGKTEKEVSNAKVNNNKTVIGTPLTGKENADYTITRTNHKKNTIYFDKKNLDIVLKHRYNNGVEYNYVKYLSVSFIKKISDNYKEAIVSMILFYFILPNILALVIMFYGIIMVILYVSLRTEEWKKISKLFFFLKIEELDTSYERYFIDKFGYNNTQIINKTQPSLENIKKVSSKNKGRTNIKTDTNNFLKKEAKVKKSIFDNYKSVMDNFKK